MHSGAHGFRSRRPRSLLTVLNFCRIRVSFSPFLGSQSKVPVDRQLQMNALTLALKSAVLIEGKGQLEYFFLVRHEPERPSQLRFARALFL